MKTLPLLIHNAFYKIQLAESLIQKNLAKWPHIVKRDGSWMPSLSTYIGSASRLIRFTFFQPSSWTWPHSALTHLVVWRSWGRFHTKTLGASLIFGSRSLIISLVKLFSVSTNYSRASFYVWIHPPSPFFLALLPVLYLQLKIPSLSLTYV